MFTNADFLPTEAWQHHTLRTPSIATGLSAAKRCARRLRVASVPTALLSINRAACFAATLCADAARSCDIYVPPLNSKRTSRASHS